MQNKKFILKYTVVFLLLLFLLTLADTGIGLIRMESELSALNGGTVFFRISQESSPFQAEIEQYRNLLSRLKETDLYTYYEISSQPLEIKDDMFRNLENEAEGTNSWTKAVQISENVLKDFECSLLSGKLFSAKDFLFDGTKDIPVILGNLYSGMYEEGSRFQGKYLYDTYTFCVIGILASDSKIQIPIGTTFLDDCVILPSFDIKEEVMVTDGLKIHYANKTSGTIKAAAGRGKQAVEYFLPFINTTEIGDYDWISSSIDLLTEQNFFFSLKQILLMEILLIIAAVFILAKIIRKQILYNNKVLNKHVLFVAAVSGTAIFINSILTYTAGFFLGFKINFIRPALIVLVLVMVISAIMLRVSKETA